MADLPTESRRVWLRAFWGFRPEEGGYLGFTKEGDRTRFIREYQEGDLVLIYGADSSETRPDQRRQLLGFLEPKPIPILDADRSSEDELKRKREHGWQDRWTFAVPVSRAWRINRRVEAHHFARVTFAKHNPVLIASRCELMVPEEAAAALALPVTPANVFGEPPLSADVMAGEAALRDSFTPSRGVTPTFGSRTYTVEDSENRLYVLKLEGDIAAYLGRQNFEVATKVLVKVGHAKDPKGRCDAHNLHIPPASVYRWKVELVSRPFPGGLEAKQAEDTLKQVFSQKFESLGREFFLVNKDALETEFARVTHAGFVLTAPS